MPLTDPKHKMKMEESTTSTAAISIEVYNSICTRVMDYMQKFNDDDPKIQKNFQLKQDHIHRVIGYTELLSRSISCDEETIMVAQIAALLHDIGRFEQFEKYHTFNDKESVDHAELGIQIVDNQQWLKDLPEDTQMTIKTAVLLHNKISLPKSLNEDTLVVTKILRDADKLDILDLCSTDYQKSSKEQNDAITLGLKPTSFVAKTIEKSLNQRQLPNKEEMTTTTEFKLMQIAYVYDLNYRESYSVVNKKGYLKKIFDALSKTDLVFETYRNAKIHVENQLM